MCFWDISYNVAAGALKMRRFAGGLLAAGFGDVKIAAKNNAGNLLDELHANTLFSAAITA